MRIVNIFQASLTALLAVVVFVIGQLIVKFFLEPIDDLRQVIGETSYALIFYSNFYTSPGHDMPELRTELSEVLRENASCLQAKSMMVKWHRLFKSLNLIPEKHSITKAAHELVFLSNSVFEGKVTENVNAKREIQKLLNIET